MFSPLPLSRPQAIGAVNSGARVAQVGRDPRARARARRARLASNSPSRTLRRVCSTSFTRSRSASRTSRRVQSLPSRSTLASWTTLRLSTSTPVCQKLLSMYSTRTIQYCTYIEALMIAPYTSTCLKVAMSNLNFLTSCYFHFFHFIIFTAICCTSNTCIDDS